MTPQQIDAMKLALEVMRNQGDVSVDEWIATEKAIKEALAEHAMRETQRLGQEIEQCKYPDCKCPTENPCLKGLVQPAKPHTT